jgi:hypothetical protein
MNAILDEHPSSLECHGPELLPLVDELRARGCIVLAATVVCVSSYRLSLAWPKPQQTNLIETGMENGA